MNGNQTNHAITAKLEQLLGFSENVHPAFELTNDSPLLQCVTDVDMQVLQDIVVGMELELRHDGLEVVPVVANESGDSWTISVRPPVIDRYRPNFLARVSDVLRFGGWTMVDNDDGSWNLCDGPVVVRCELQEPRSGCFDLVFSFEVFS